ncbi:tRNA/rRNA methyltransferase, SpoU [Heracleum sosnowskyi]|uniref:rRNA methyltransferase 1, mitochondrial n=1 Tax=Heracleum sosnowskyi TaxID=360622 RepID=A0AAD8MLE6_9APIA|nr:tRNA/rRNA methyltransferase, SpoU [Heracleum sosnowskyi]
MNCKDAFLSLFQENVHLHLLRSPIRPVGSCYSEGKVLKFGTLSGFSGGLFVGVRGFSSSGFRKIGGGGGGNGGGEGKVLPWLAKGRFNNGKKSERPVAGPKVRSSWEESAESFLKGSAAVVENGDVREGENRRGDFRKRVGSAGGVENREGRGYERRGEVRKKGGSEEEGNGEVEEGKDPRWDNIKNRFGRIVDVKPRSERPEFRRWDQQEMWGKKTWKEGTESTLPKMTGEGVYGVGPVLAALSAGRREFYTLYTQEGLDLSTNNKKKKDKKGFEKVLRIAEKLGLSKKEISKHDLNMISDNRPHQGLVLDASPLEMVSIKELDPVPVDEGNGLLWLALDEVTDPQNLGAIIRSAYFFGAAGVVLCAKNSAPLSGVVSKASAGSLELMELRSCKNMMQFLVSSADNGWRVLGGSVAPKAIPLDEVVPGSPTILVLGSEGTGLRPLVERSCTQLIKIPGNIPVDVSAGVEDDDETSESNQKCSAEEFRSFLAVESLNVSVAAGVLLHHLIGSKGDSQIQEAEN